MISLNIFVIYVGGGHCDLLVLGAKKENLAMALAPTVGFFVSKHQLIWPFWRHGRVRVGSNKMCPRAEVYEGYEDAELGGYIKG